MKTGRVTVGTSAVQLDLSAAGHIETGIKIYAASGNAVNVFVSNASTITADSADATDGYPIKADTEIFIPAHYFRGSSSLWFRAGQAAQKVWFVTV